MTEQTRIVRPHFRPRTVLTESGEKLHPPDDWDLLPPGDAALTRKVKAAGPSWTVQLKKGRKVFSHGVWAPKENIEAARTAVEEMREDPAHQKRQQAAQVRRQKKEVEYTEDFRASVLEFLNFDARYADLAGQFADAVSAHATPVGSGTVARTQRIPIEERAEAAVIAWMRHQTSAYDRIKVPRLKGARRDLRRQIAERSRSLLQSYRNGTDVDLDTCPLYRALQRV